MIVMDITMFVGGIGFLIILAALYSLRQSASDIGIPMKTPKEQFTIHFADGKFAPAIQVEADDPPEKILQAFNLIHPRPTIFISGGASDMSEDDIALTRQIMEECIAAFAAKHHITVIDGGTEAGVMDMIGEARLKHKYKFPLVGVAPLHKVEFPNYKGKGAEAELQHGHSHFVLVNADEWGGESNMIVALTKAIADGGEAPMVGILINGGKIAEREVYLASASGEKRMPLIIVEGSGRTADNISTAFKTQSTDSALIRAIIQGADIRLTELSDGVAALEKELNKVFGSEVSK